MAKQSSKSRKKSVSVKEYLENLSPAELVSYVLDLARRSPEIQRDLEQRALLAGGDTGELLRKARKELRDLASDRYWNDWEDRYDAADYGHLKTLFERLLSGGQADALLDLGRELLEKATEHMENSEDEGDTDEDLLACFATVFQAVPLSSRPDVEKMLYLIDLSLADEFDLTDGMNYLFEREWPVAVWSAVADEMIRRLESAHSSRTEAVRSYRRDELFHWLDQALEASGRESELIPLLERDAAASGGYVRLVDALIAAKRWDDARLWILEGLGKKIPDQAWSADTLCDRWRTLAEHRKDWATVAAMAADTFFSRPSPASFAELLKAAKKAGCEEAVRAAALLFLEKGNRPDGKGQPEQKSPPSKSSAKKVSAAPAPDAWPLPALPAVVVRRSEFAPAPGPQYDVLLDLALAEKNPDEVLRWYDRLAEAQKGRKTPVYSLSDHRPRVADAVAKSHPDRAATLYRDLIAEQLAYTKVSAYQSAQPYLVDLKALLTKNNRAAEWTQYLESLRQTHARKPRLLEVLDEVERGRSKR